MSLCNIESVSVSVMVYLWCKSQQALPYHRPLLSVIVQTFEVEPFSVCKPRHLQRKWKKCTILKGAVHLEMKFLNSDFQVKLSSNQNKHDIVISNSNKINEEWKCKTDLTWISGEISLLYYLLRDREVQVFF